MTQSQEYYMVSLSQKVYERRVANGSGEGRGRKIQSLRDAAEQIGISYATMSRVERCETVSLDVFMKLRLWLGISADEALGIKE